MTARVFKQAKKPGQMIELLFRIAKNRHNEFMHDTVTAERRCSECQFLKRVKTALKINDDWAMEDGFQGLLDRLGGRSTTEYQRRPLPPCPTHRRYQAVRKPTADCRHCWRLWRAQHSPLLGAEA